MVTIPLKPFYLLRHGETVANAEGYAAGSLDTPLTEKGREQAIETQKIVLDLSPLPEIVFHSPLSRARDTAGLVTIGLRLDMTSHDGLAEQDYGEWVGKPWTEVRPLLHRNVPPPNGETRDIFFQRTQNALAECLNRTDLLPLIVAHGGTFDAFWEYMGVPRSRTPNCALFAFLPNEKGAWDWTDHTIDSFKTHTSCNCTLRQA